jgi:long-subunit fatty acid transport protein
MQHKAPRLILFITVSLVFGFGAVAQNLTRSPYSIIGIGETQFQGTSLQSSMGQAGQGIRRMSDINTLNPASYSSLRYTVIEAGLIYDQGTLSQGSNKSDIDNSSFTYFMIGLPLSVKYKLGLVFGLAPYSSIGYNVSTTASYPYYTATTQMTGTGGLSKFNMGIGAQVVRNVSVGMNLAYIFGQLNTEQKLLIPSEFNKYNIAETRSRIVGGSQLQGGVQYHKGYEKGLKKDKYNFTAGATYTVAALLSGKQEYFVRTMPVGSTLGTKDTIAYTDSEKGNIELPYSFSIGAGWEKKDQWAMAFDVHTTNWSAYRSFGSTDSLQNSFGFNLGGSFIPNVSDKHYYNRVEYRAGVRYDLGNLVLANHSISSYGLSVGLGLPLGKPKKYAEDGQLKPPSKLNITGEYFVKGTTSDNLIKEEYFRIIIGINFSDKWFQRTKYE